MVQEGVTEALTSMKLMGSSIGRLVVLLGVLSLGGCAGNVALRSAGDRWSPQAIVSPDPACRMLYAQNDADIWAEISSEHSTHAGRGKLLDELSTRIDQALAARDSPGYQCWRTSYENHQGLPVVPPSRTPDREATPEDQPGPPPGYDLFFAEFDDQGERTDVAVDGVAFNRSEAALIEAKLEEIWKAEADQGGGINLVLLTHGWHGSAAASNEYATMFKAILQQIAKDEHGSRRQLCQALRGTHGPDSAAIPLATMASLRERGCGYIPGANPAGHKERRTVGVEIAWRGDSATLEPLSYLSFWDRKGAAETVARGAVRDLLARLHRFYLKHSCRGGVPSTPEQVAGRRAACDQVHMLTLGHSFGALIDYESLAESLSTGLLGDRERRAYSYGDLTILLNPAVEGERLAPLVQAAKNPQSAYPSTIVPGESDERRSGAVTPPGAQFPILVILQSEGDWPTRYAFPAARLLLGSFENAPGVEENERSVRALGWVDAFRTHRLTVSSDPHRDVCDRPDADPAWLCPFNPDPEKPPPFPVGLARSGPEGFPSYFPIWNVAVSTNVMRDHDDIWNPAFVRFMAQLFRDAYDQADRINERYAGSLPSSREVEPAR